MERERERDREFTNLLRLNSGVIARPEIVLSAATSTRPPKAAERAVLWVKAALSFPLPRRRPEL